MSPNTPELMAVAKYWFEQHGAVPAAMSHDELEFLLPAPVPEEKAMDAAVELYGFCPDVIDQGPEDATVGRSGRCAAAVHCLVLLVGLKGGFCGIRCEFSPSQKIKKFSPLHTKKLPLNNKNYR